MCVCVCVCVCVRARACVRACVRACACVCGAGGGMVDPMVKPPPQTVDDLEDLTGEPGEVPSASDHVTPHTVSPADRKKVLLVFCLEFPIVDCNIMYIHCIYMYMYTCTLHSDYTCIYCTARKLNLADCLRGVVGGFKLAKWT